MIKNETNRQANKPKPLTTTTPTTSLYQKTAKISNDSVVNRPVHVAPVVQPLSKVDLIRKFEASQTKESAPSNVHQAIIDSEKKSIEKPDDDEQAHSSNSDEYDNDSGNQSDNNNSNSRNGHGNNNGGPVPPKPLPRTSRNNSISSTSSDQGVTLSIANVAHDEPQIGVVRPVAKPRTTAASYKVHIPWKTFNTWAHPVIRFV